jgi:hypothetical protein
VVARGRVHRVVVDRDRFLAKAARK